MADDIGPDDGAELGAEGSKITRARGGRGRDGAGGGEAAEDGLEGWRPEDVEKDFADSSSCSRSWQTSISCWTVGSFVQPIGG